MTQTTMDRVEVLEPEEISSVANILKSTRLAHGLTLKQASLSLRISERQLSLLEEDHPLTLNVYTIGFIKLYAQYLGLEPQKIIEMFKKQVSDGSHSTDLAFLAPLPGKGRPTFRVLGLSLFILTLVIIGVTYIWEDYSIPSSLQIERVSPQKVKALPTQHSEDIIVKTDVPHELPAEILKEKAALEPPPSTPLLPATQPVTLEAREKTWIEVKDGEGHIILNRIFQPGESYEFKDGQNLFLTTGNLKGVHLSSSDKTFPQSGKAGEVKRNIPLDPEKWLEDNPGDQ